MAHAKSLRRKTRRASRYAGFLNRLESIEPRILFSTSLVGTATQTYTAETSSAYSSNSYMAVEAASHGTGSYSYTGWGYVEFGSNSAVFPSNIRVGSIDSLSLQLYNSATTGNYAPYDGSFSVYLIPDDSVAASSVRFQSGTGITSLGTASGGASTLGVTSDDLLGTFSTTSLPAGYSTFNLSLNADNAAQNALISDLNSKSSVRLAVVANDTNFATDWEGNYSSSVSPILSLTVEQASTVVENFGFSAANYTVNESAGTATVTVSRDSDADAASVSYSTSDGTALAGTNYTAASGTLNFAANQSTASFTVSIADLAAMDGSKTLRVALSNPVDNNAGYAVQLGTPSTAEITITDSYATGANTANLSANTDQEGTIETTGSYSTTYFNVAGTANYYASFGVVDFNSSGEFTPATPVAAINSITLNLTQGYPPQGVSGPMNVYLVADSTTDIGAGSSPLLFDTTDPTGEGVGAQLGTKSLLGSFVWNASSPSDVYTQIALIDYNEATEATLVNDLNTGAKFRLVITPENPSVQGSFEGSYSSGVESPQLSFNVTTAAQLAFASATYSANESDGAAAITVNRSSSSVGAVSVNYATSDGTATAGADYTVTSGTLNFADGQTSATFTIPLTDVQTIAGNKTVNITLSDPSLYAVLGSQTTATLDITDNQSVGATAPALVSTQVGDGSAQRSSIHSFTITFNEAVNFNNNSFSVLQYATDSSGNLTGASTDVSSGFSASSTDGGTTWTISVTASGSMDRSGASGLLKDGVYQIVLNGDAITDLATGTAQFNAGGSQIATFSSSGHANSDYVAVLFGDFNGDGTINNTDVVHFNAAFGSTGYGGNYNAIYDFNGDGSINNTDVVHFNANFGKTIHYT